MKIAGNIIDLRMRSIYAAELVINGGRITSIDKTGKALGQYLLPGFIDSHLHIESSMVTPAAFASGAVRHGTVAVIADPHEIANVLGVQGVLYMTGNAASVPFRFAFGVPSCVPATPFESNGARITADDVEGLFKLYGMSHLSEVMNYPGVIAGDNEIIEKINIARKLGKRIDGHAPGLKGEDLKIYAGYGISTDHECSSIEEAREKIRAGMKIQIREGSAARNLRELHELFNESPVSLMLCCDDIHPDDLVKGHINMLVRKLLSAGYNIFDVLNAACVNPAKHYGLNTGMLQVGDSADFIVVDNLDSFNIKETYIFGEKVYGEGRSHFSINTGKALNRFNSSGINRESISCNVQGRVIRVIEAYDGQLYTGSFFHKMKENGNSCDTDNDILKIVVKDRYQDYPPVIGFIRGFGLKYGAIASSVAHDSHNIIAVGTDDDSIIKAINLIVDNKGGLVFYSTGRQIILPLEIAGIMTEKPLKEVGVEYTRLTEAAQMAGSKLKAPYMTLSFMALLVIPELKIGDRGLFDVRQFNSVPLIAE